MTLNDESSACAKQFALVHSPLLDLGQSALFPKVTVTIPI